MLILRMTRMSLMMTKTMTTRRRMLTKKMSETNCCWRKLTYPLTYPVAYSLTYICSNVQGIWQRLNLQILTQRQRDFYVSFLMASENDDAKFWSVSQVNLRPFILWCNVSVLQSDDKIIKWITKNGAFPGSRGYVTYQSLPVRMMYHHC